MTNITEYIIIGKIASPYGVRGWLKINSYTELSANILNYTPWYLMKEHNQWYAETIEKGRIHDKGVIVKFNGINTPEKARSLTGKLIAIKHSQLPDLKKGEYYWSDLEGLTVINQNDHVLGKVIYLLETGSNDVLIIKGDKEYAIPYLLGSVVHSVDLKKQEIRVHWEFL